MQQHRQKSGAPVSVDYSDRWESPPRRRASHARSATDASQPSAAYGQIHASQCNSPLKWR